MASDDARYACLQYAHSHNGRRCSVKRRHIGRLQICVIMYSKQAVLTQGPGV